MRFMIFISDLFIVHPRYLSFCEFIYSSLLLGVRPDILDTYMRPIWIMNIFSIFFFKILKRYAHRYIIIGDFLYSNSFGQKAENGVESKMKWPPGYCDTKSLFSVAMENIIKEIIQKSFSQGQPQQHWD